MENTRPKAEFKQPDGFKEVQLTNNEDPVGIRGKLGCDSTQLWLIQAPSDVDINSFHGFKVVLSDEPARCKIEETGREFEVITKVNDASSKFTPGNSTVVFNADNASNELTPVMKPFAGHLIILDNIPIPKLDLPRISETKKVIPEGLRQRFILSGADNRLEYKMTEGLMVVKPEKHKRSKSQKNLVVKREIENVTIHTLIDEVSTPTKTSSSRKRRKSQIISVECNAEEVVIDEDFTNSSSLRKMKASESVIEEMKVDDAETPKKRRKHAKSEQISEVTIKMEAKSPKKDGSTVRSSKRSRR